MQSIPITFATYLNQLHIYQMKFVENTIKSHYAYAIIWLDYLIILFCPPFFCFSIIIVVDVD